ncbi:hypothetical protein SRHO_G00320360 [Serrasalmus rhombeus]
MTVRVRQRARRFSARRWSRRETQVCGSSRLFTQPHLRNTHLQAFTSACTSSPTVGRLAAEHGVKNHYGAGKRQKLQAVTGKTHWLELLSCFNGDVWKQRNANTPHFMTPDTHRLYYCLLN